MSKLINISGRRFGALVAIRPIPSAETADHRPGWKVHCDCGRDKIVNASNLRSGKITSCGCGIERGRRISASLNAAGRHIDLTGQTFGELTALEFVRADLWRWRCSCGREIEARASLVKTGRIVSCGHVLAQTARDKIASNVLRHHDGSSVPHIEHIMQGKTRKNNTTGITGVSIRAYKGYQMFRASICVRGKTIYLGEFQTLNEAAAARKRAEEAYFAPIIEDFRNK